MLSSFAICRVVLMTAFCSFGVHGRAVNISGAWFLPQEKFPLFYRYFKDKVTWDEARNICDRHGGSLISLEHEDQREAIKAYLTELEVITRVWIGLRKEIYEKYFSWMHGARVGTEGYWLHPNPKSETALCCSLDPAYDFRWTNSHCGGPETASFVCELRVPEWAKKCMVPELQSLSVTYEPELGVIALISDCGLAGTRRIVCKGRTKKEDLLQELSCDEDPFTVHSPTERRNHGNSMASARMNGKDSVTQMTNEWAIERQTRHRRSLTTITSSKSTTNSSIANTSQASTSNYVRS